jgi:hypothetical protein
MAGVEPFLNVEGCSLVHHILSGAGENDAVVVAANTCAPSIGLFGSVGLGSYWRTTFDIPSNLL